MSSVAGLPLLLLHMITGRSSTVKTNQKQQSSSSTVQTSDKPAYPPALKDHIEEDYDPYKNFLINGNDTNADRGLAMSQNLRGWEEIWDRASSGAKDNQGMWDSVILLGLSMADVIKRSQRSEVRR